MKFEVLSTIVVDVNTYRLDENGSIECLNDQVLTFSFKTQDLALIIFRGGPNELLVDDKCMKFLNNGVVFQSNNELWMTVKDSKQFFRDCIDAYTKAKCFEMEANL